MHLKTSAINVEEYAKSLRQDVKVTVVPNGSIEARYQLAKKVAVWRLFEENSYITDVVTLNNPYWELIHETK